MSGWIQAVMQQNTTYLQALLLFYHACFHNAWFSKTHAARSNYANSANTHKKDFISIKQCANSVQTQSQYTINYSLLIAVIKWVSAMNHLMTWNIAS